MDELADRKGPLSVAIAATLTEVGGRIVVFGDSDFATNAYFNLSGNRDLILNAISCLSGDEQAIAIRPRTRQTTPLYLKETDQKFLLVVPTLGLPVFFLLTGASVFVWRRRFH